MDCREIFEGLSDYIDDELAEKACGEIEQHLKSCENCRIVVNTLRKTVTLYHSIDPETVPGEVSLRLHATIRLEMEKDLP